MKSMALIAACACVFALPVVAEENASFMTVDTNADNLVSQFEFIRFVTANTGMPSTDALVQFIEIDTNRSRTLSQNEWGTAYAVNPWIQQISTYVDSQSKPKPIRTDKRWLAQITN